MDINIFYVALSVATLFLLCVFFSTIFSKVNIVKLVVVGIALFFAEYCIFASILLTLDHFHVSYALIGALVCNLVLCVCRYKHIKEGMKRIDFNIRGCIAALLIVGICTCFTLVKSDDIVPGYDAGVYGQKAISMTYGENSAVTEIEEYNVDNQILKDSAKDLWKSQKGLYNVAATRGTQEADSVGDDQLLVEYHGFPVWPAVMALWGAMFGAANMLQVLSMLFMCAALGLYFIVESLAKNKYAKFLALILFAFSPLIINVAKNALTETIYVCFVIIGILLLLQKERKLKMTAIVPMSCLCFLHFTTLIYSPIIFIALLYLGIIKKDKIYHYIGILFNVVLLLSFVYAFRVSSYYTVKQMRNMLGEKITSEQGLLIFSGMVAIMIAIQVVFLLWEHKKKGAITKVEQFLDKRLLLICRVLMIFIFAVCVYKTYLMCFTDYYPPTGGAGIYRTYGGSGIGAIRYMNIFTILLSTAWICVPYLTYKIFSQKAEWSSIAKAFLLVFIYAFAYQIVIRTDSSLIYYIARYFVIFLIPSAIILVAISIKSNKVIIAFVLVCIATSIPFNLTQINVRERLGSSEMVNAAIANIEPGAVVVVDAKWNGQGEYTGQVLAQNLKERNNNLVYDMNDENVIEAALASYQDRAVYYITSMQDEDKNFENIAKYTLDQGGSFSSTTGIFPTDFEIVKQPLYIYRVRPDAKIVVPVVESWNYKQGDANWKYSVTATVDGGTKTIDGGYFWVWNSDLDRSTTTAIYPAQKDANGNFSVQIDLEDSGGQPGHYAVEFYAESAAGRAYAAGYMMLINL